MNDIKIEEHFGLVWSAIHRYTHVKASLHEELFQEGVVALLVARKYWNKDRATTFGSFATQCIKQRFSLFLHNNRMIRPPRTSFHKLMCGNKSKMRGRTAEAIQTCMAMGREGAFDDRPTESETLSEIDQEDEAHELKKVIDALLEPREQRIVRLLYGIGVNEPWDNRSVAKLFNLNRNTITTIRKKALQKLRTYYTRDYHAGDTGQGESDQPSLELNLAIQV